MVPVGVEPADCRGLGLYVIIACNRGANWLPGPMALHAALFSRPCIGHFEEPVLLKNVDHMIVTFFVLYNIDVSAGVEPAAVLVIPSHLPNR